MIIRIIFILVLLVTLGCSQNLKIMWNPADDADITGVTHYEVYKWEGDSTAQYLWDEIQMVSIGTLPHIQNFSGPYEFQTFFAEDKWIRGGCIAVDSLGRVSPMGLSRFYGFPGNLEEVWIGK